MAKECSVLLLMAFVISCMIIGSTAQPDHVVHIVGGGKGWTLPPNKTFYDEWAATKNITVGDKLMFLFHTSIYNIMQVSKEDYDTCNDRNVINRWFLGPTIINITEPGMHYYYDEIGLHCEAGQKLAINVMEKSSNGVNAAAASGSNMLKSSKYVGFFGTFVYFAYSLFM
ncbi:hypothetical protein LUZ60_000549 [Juncus effusus]|nr:hypothetical protein LUZ60_000549 [Juncus effusus]